MGVENHAQGDGEDGGIGERMLPRTRVARRSWGRSRSCATILPRRGWRWVICANCHWLNENKAVSASAKKKLAPANKRMADSACSTGRVWRKLLERGKKGNEARRRRRLRRKIYLVGAARQRVFLAGPDKNAGDAGW